MKTKNKLIIGLLVLAFVLAGIQNVRAYIYNPSIGNGTGTVTSFSVVTANGVSASVANSTSTPAATFTLGALTPTSIAATGAITTSSPSASFGYATGAGCAVTQITSRTTGVSCTGNSGAITLVSASGSATPATFTVTDTSVAAGDTIIVNEKSGTDVYETFITAVAGGSFKITSFTTGGTTSEQPVFNFADIKAVSS